MKYKLTLLFFLTSYILFGQNSLEGTNVYQSSINYYNLRVKDLNEFKFSDLKLKEIKQSTLFTKYNFELKISDSTYYLEYILKFDTLNNISSVLYDFSEEYTSKEKIDSIKSNGLIPGPVNRRVLNSKDRLYKFASLNDTIFYNYYENIYEYNENGSELTAIKIIKPQRDGIIDGVYKSENNQENIRYKNYVKNNILYKKEMYVNEKLFWTTVYIYKTIKTKYQTMNLIEKIIEQEESLNKNKYEISLEYIFEN
jgi:hypothetical protein